MKKDFLTTINEVIDQSFRDKIDTLCVDEKNRLYSLLAHFDVELNNLMFSGMLSPLSEVAKLSIKDTDYIETSSAIIKQALRVFFGEENFNEYIIVKERFSDFEATFIIETEIFKKM